MEANDMFRRLFQRKATAQASTEMRQQLGDSVREYERIAPTLRALLYTPEEAGPVAEKLLMREDLPGLHTVAMFDMPNTFGNVNPKYAELWGVSAEQVLNRAVANSVREPTSVLHLQVAPGVAVTAVSGEHAWVCAHALAVDNHLGLLSAFGALIAVPHRQHILAHAIRDKSAGTALGIMIKMVHACLSEGPPKPISKNVFWYRQGRYERIQAFMQGDVPMHLHADNSEFLREVAQPLGFACTLPALSMKVASFGR
jgi:hypothetical protein